MRSVCALNFEAMSILDPAEQSFAQQKMEQELQRQVENAMMMPEGNYNPPATRSEISFNLSEAGDQQPTSQQYQAYESAQPPQQFQA